MLALQPKQVKIFVLASICICGLSIGYFCAQLAGVLLQPEEASGPAAGNTDRAGTPRTVAVDTGLILDRNIFDPAMRGQEQEPEQPARETSAPVNVVTASDLKLFGTVDGGNDPLALIESGGKVKVYRIGDEIPGGGQLLEVSRNEAIITRADGSRAKLVIVKPELASTARTSTPTGGGIRSLGDNRWTVARDEVEKARSNLNQLLKSARMEPNIVNGQTEGFIVKMVRPKSLLAQLGIRRGDKVRRVNGVELNSQEKALQIFQQLREAKRLTVDLERGNENLTFDYEVN
ncbi:MAG: hypothetical protein C0623_14525 [Desulfuromonas sp.]|nr:MAG: hypothetical protein C0623_14525 [Desulfuromonas sp.]